MPLTWEECGGYVPMMERNHNPTAHDEMMRLMDECARLGKENAALRSLLQEAIDGMGGAYAIWAPKARAALTPNV